MPLALAPPPARRCHYRQREAFLSPLWRILVDHLDTFVATYDSRFFEHIQPLAATRTQNAYQATTSNSPTITLDEVVAGHWYKVVTFVEIEMELNEIAYTAAGPAERDAMLAVNEILRTDLMTTFPDVQQDQTPKYNKAVALLRQQMPTFGVSLALGFPPEIVLVGLLGILLPVLLYRRALARREKSRQKPRYR